MKFLNKMERKFGKYAIHNFSAFIIATYVAGYLMSIFAPRILSYLTLEPYRILRGEVWRIVTWILVPPGDLDIWTIIMLFFYYSVGSTLERTWGAFRYNVYIISGILFTVIGSFILYFALGGNIVFGVLSKGLFSTYYINMSIMLAFAASYPDAQVMLYFFIPIKIKWIGILYGITIIANFIYTSWVGKVAILASLLNFVLYFISTRDKRKYSYKEHMRKREFKKAVQPNAARTAKKSTITRHKCAVCGRTELDDENLEFRFCSKCDGNYEYCQDHLFTHEHVRLGK